MKQGFIQDRGFEAFSQGTFGNAGHNLYVSKKGIVQRIHLFDVNGDGYVDLPFANSHDDGVRVPAYVYANPLEGGERIEIPSEGAFAGAVADLNNDGYDDLVIANQYNGASNYAYAQVYYGSPEGYSSKRMLQLWAPSAISVAIGDFNGDGRKDIAFISFGQLRIFYQEPSGFRTKGYVDLELDHTLDSLVSMDLDGDGFDDLAVRTGNSRLVIYWGGPEGIRADNRTWLDPSLTGEQALDAGLDSAASGAGAGSLFVFSVPAAPKLKAVKLKGTSHLFACRDEQVLLIPILPDRRIGRPLVLDSGPVTGVSVGDVRGRGGEDLILSSRQAGEDGIERSWIYWDSESGYSEDRRTPFVTRSAADVVAADLSGNGCSDIIVCQDKTDHLYSFESLIYRGSPGGLLPEPIRLETHCAAGAFVAKAMDAERPQVIFLNHLTNRILGDVPVYLYLGGPEGFSPERRLELPGWAATELRICDFDDDGYPDIFMANSNENAMHLDNGSFVYYNGPDGFRTDKRVELPTRHSMNSCCADLNRDGWLDLIVAGHNNDELLIFYGSEAGFVDAPVRIPLVADGVVYRQPRFMTLADLNNDGWLDLVAPDCGATDDLLILWGGPEGFDIGRRTLLPEGAGISSRAADLTGNGWLDLIVGGFKGPDQGDPYATFVYIYWGGPEGFSNDRRTELPAHFAADLAVADFNNDGILDIFVACYHGTRTRDIDSYIYWGEPGGRFSADNRTRLFGHSAAGALAADFNEDGYVDLAMANHKTYGNHPGMSFVWWNGPNGFSESDITRLPTNGPHGMTHSDIGNVMDRGPEEYYESRTIALPDGAELAGISWIADIPPKTWVKAQIRVADREEDLPSQPWQGDEGAGTWFGNGHTAMARPVKGRWAQYRLALGAINSGSTPRVSEVRLSYNVPSTSTSKSIK
ncbi:Repeat domain-containing protein [Paenibacillus sp. UNCCL117]|uniref:FG-GAP repeat domain-containing protein n=1 Tax=unclassified Paenibacillus TaxID=185978 RepID=UPI000883FACF|nr:MULTISPECIES: VCBS repeat-containing protein [unclassified Paenibacillus]SDD24639.1 Repeat domain-containing protein [Paenibacillus sp. cl123]SFW41446.1 Repeat domain-containing protein [Paenibacillus sp. UNCCL117]